MCQTCFESCTYFITLVEQNLYGFIFFIYFLSVYGVFSLCLCDSNDKGCGGYVGVPNKRS